MTRCHEYLDDILERIESNEPLTEEQKAHIETCESCKAFYEDMQYVFELERNGQLEALPDTFQESFRERLEQERGEQGNTGAHLEQDRVVPFVRNRKWIPSLGAAAILMMAIIGSGTIPGLLARESMKEAVIGDSMNETQSAMVADQMAVAPAVSAAPVPQQPAIEAKRSTAENTVSNDAADAYSGTEGQSLMAVEPSAENSESINEAARTFSASTPAVEEKAQQLKIIKNGTISLETTEFDVNLARIEAITKTLNGQIASKNVVQLSSGGSADAKNPLRSAWLQVKVPEAAFEEAISAMKASGLVLSTSENSQDITKEYHDVDSHIKNLKARETSLRDLMTKATDMKSLLEIDQALAEVRSQIDALTATLSSYDQAITYSTIEINLVEVESIAQSLRVSPLDQVKAGLGDSGRLLSLMFEKGLYVTALLMPYGILFFGTRAGMKRFMRVHGAHRAHDAADMETDGTIKRQSSNKEE